MNLEQMVADLGTLVRCESPSSDLASVATSADVVADLGRRLLGVDPERIVIDGCTHLRWRFGGDRPVLLLGHHDTVWSLGTLSTHPWQVADGRAYGPGCYDMKAGLVQMFHAVASLPTYRGVTVLVTGDEELGAPSSRDLIEGEARRSRAALVFEGSGDGGALKTARKGAFVYRLEVRGRAAHSGLEPWAGVNAAVELAHQILALEALGDGPDGSTVTPTVLAAGTTVNTVPAMASVGIDVRTPTLAEHERIDGLIQKLTPMTDGASLDVKAVTGQAPMEPSASAELFALAAGLAESLGLGSLAGVSVGGSSDANFTAGVGTPTLDGLGAVGGGAHAPTEHVIVGEMPRRAALAARLVEVLLDRPGPDGIRPHDACDVGQAVR